MESCQQNIDARGGAISSKEAHLFEAVRRLYSTADGLSKTDSTWVVQTKDDGKGLGIVVKPTSVASLAQEHLWDKVPNVVLMSGSTVSPEDMLPSVGLDSNNVVLIEAPNPTPPTARPIYYMPVARVSKRDYSTPLPLLADAIDSLVYQLTEGEFSGKGIIHTWNGTITTFLAENCRTSAMFFTHDIGDRLEVFNDFRTAPSPAVLVSPSTYYGEDFPGDQARWQIVAKVPYPNLGDPWVQAKMQYDPQWFQRETVMSIVQTVGRIVRGPDDFGVTYILDSNFGRLWSEVNHLFPFWLREALIVYDPI